MPLKKLKYTTLATRYPYIGFRREINIETAKMA
jgi:hypothetical protein